MSRYEMASPLEPQSFLNPVKFGEFIVCRALRPGEVVFRVRDWSNLQDGLANARARGFRPQFVYRVKQRNVAKMGGTGR